MATAASQLSGLTSMASLIPSLLGSSSTKTQTTSGTKTSGQDISADGITRIINQMLGGQGGVKDISGTARGTGLFNSSTEALLRNDLATRVAGEAAKLSAKQVDTTDETTTMDANTPGILGSNTIGKAALGLGGAALLKPVVSMLTGHGAGDSLLAPAFRALGLGAGEPLAMSGNLASSAADFTPSLSVSLGDTAGGALSGAADSIGNVISGLTGGGGKILDGTLGSIGDLASTGFSAPIANAATGAAASAGFGMAGPAGGILGGLLGGTEPGDMGPLGLAGAALGGLATMGPPGLILGPAFSMIGGGLGNASIICTALVSKGLLDKDEYALGSAYLETLAPETLMGYYSWGVPVAKKIAANSAWAIALCLPFAASRMHLFGSKSRFKYLKYPLGTITKFIGQPLCYMIGWAIQLFDALGAYHAR